MESALILNSFMRSYNFLENDWYIYHSHKTELIIPLFYHFCEKRAQHLLPQGKKNPYTLKVINLLKDRSQSNLTAVNNTLTQNIQCAFVRCNSLIRRVTRYTMYLFAIVRFSNFA